VRPLDDRYFEELARPRAAAALSVAFAAVATIAAAAGLFSVLSFAVGRRRHEFGIRIALGATPGQVRRLVVGDGVRVALAGIAVGTIAAVALSRALSSLQYGVTPGDPITWAAVVGVITTTTMMASWRPARQAMRTDPLVLLKDE
jgi:putative ABC transport system permease protein